MSKRILALLMVLCMVFSLCPLTVFAEEEAQEVTAVEEAVTEPGDEPDVMEEAEPVEEFAEEPVEESAEESVEEIVEEPAEEPAEEPEEESAEEPAEESAEEPVEEPAEEPEEETGEPEPAEDGEGLPSGTCGSSVSWAFSLDHTDPSTGEEWYVLSITGSGAMDDYNYIWDEENNDWSSESEFAPWRDCDTWHIVKVVFDGSITHIGDHAFRDFNNLESITVPSSVTSIGAFAFSNCTWWDDSGNVLGGLESVTIPKTVQTIGERAFEQCQCLETVNYGENTTEELRELAGKCYQPDGEEWAPFDRMREVFMSSPWINVKDDLMFDNGKCGDNLTWAYSVDRVDNQGTDHEERFYTLTITGSGAMDNYDYIWDEENNDWSSESEFAPWRDCDTWHIVKVVIENGVTSIGDHAFRDFNNLETVSIPDTVTSIGREAFCNCVAWNEDGTEVISGLASVDIPTSVTTIGGYAFGECRALETVTYGGESDKTAQKTIAELCLAGGEDDGRTLYDWLWECFANTPWYDSLFGQREVNSLSDITKASAMHDTVWHFTPAESGIYVFTANSTEKTAMDIRRDLGDNGEEWLNGCGGTGAHGFVVFLKAGVQYNFYAGIHDDGLSFDPTEVDISVTMQYLGMDNIGTCGDNLTIGVEEAENGLVLVITGHGAMDDYFYEWDEEGNEINSNPAPWRALSDQFVEIKFVGDAEGGITHIGSHAFRDFNNLESVTIPDTVTSIGAEAFSNCVRWEYDEERRESYPAGLRSVAIPASVTSIGGYAFGGCDCLETVTYDGGSSMQDYKSLADACRNSGEYEGWTLRDCLKDCFMGSVWADALFASISVGNPSELTTLYVMHSSYAEFTPETTGFYKFSACAEEETQLTIWRVVDGSWEYMTENSGMEYEVYAYLEIGTTYIIGGGVLDDGNTFEDRSIPFSLTFTMVDMTNLGSCGDNLTWGLDMLEGGGYKLVITGHGDMYDYHYEWDEYGETDACVYQPWRTFTWDTYEIEFVGDAEGGITHIGSHAFRDFNNLESVTIPDTVKSIGLEAFSNCVYWEYDEERRESYPAGGLRSVAIPASVTSIGGYAFGGCNCLETVTYGGGSSMQDCKSLAEACQKGGEYENWSLRNYLEDCFQGSVWANALFGQKQVDNPSQLTTLYVMHSSYAEFTPGTTGFYKFSASAAEESQLIIWRVEDDSWEYMSENSGMEYEVYAYLEVGATYIIEGGILDDGNTFEDRSIPFSLTFTMVDMTNLGSCGDDLTWGLDMLEGGGYKLVITGHGAMYDYCYEWDEYGETDACIYQPWRIFTWDIYEIEFVGDTEGGITHIGSHAFRDFCNLSEVVIPDTVKSIGEEAFAWATDWNYDEETKQNVQIGLSSLTIPTGIEEIGRYAFGGCQNLTTVTYGDNSPAKLKELAKKCQSDGSLYDAINEVFEQTPWCSTVLATEDMVSAADLTKAYTRRNVRCFYLTVEEGDAVNYRITATCESPIYMEIDELDDEGNCWYYTSGDSGKVLELNARLREGTYRISIYLEEEEPSFELYSEPVTVTVEEIEELTSYEITTQNQLKNALYNAESPVGTITILNDITITEDCVLLPTNENYYYAVIIIPEGVTVTVKDGAYFGADTKNYQGKYGDMLETGIRNFGTIRVLEGSELYMCGSNTEAGHIVNKESGTVLLEDGSFARIQGVNAGTIELKSGAELTAQYWGFMTNRGTIKVNEGAELWTMMYGYIYNGPDGVIELNGTLYTGYGTDENGHDQWLQNWDGTFTGNGKVYVYQSQWSDLVPEAVSEVEETINCSTITVTTVPTTEEPAFTGEEPLKWERQHDDGAELMVRTNAVSRVTDITVDDQPLSEDFCYVWGGGRLVFIYDYEVLDNLELGDHSIVITYETGTVTIPLTVVETTRATVVVPEKENGVEVDADTAWEALSEVTGGIDVSDTTTTTEAVKKVLSGSVSEDQLDDISGKVADAISKSKEISVEMTSTVISTLETAEQQLLDGAIWSTDTIANYVDISVGILADGEPIGDITQLTSPVTVTVELPVSKIGTLTCTDTVNTRVFVLQIHDGALRYIPGVYDAESGIFTFKIDSFSTFAIVARTYTRGDINGDKASVTASDLVAMASYLAGDSTNINLPAVDVNGDNEQNLLDLVLLVKKSANPSTVTIY